jgi:hypothetical protein
MEYARLSRNVDFIERAEEIRRNYSPGEEINYLFETRKHLIQEKPKTTAIDLDRLNKLHLNAAVAESCIQKKSEPLPLCLLTEKFFWKYPTANLGSSRHGLLFDYQIKGVGRNPLATRNDHTHSWGGQYLWQGLKAYVLGHVLKGLSPLGVLNTTMVSTHTPELLESIRASSLCLTLREADATRVTQVVTGFDPNMKITQESIQKKFLKNLGVKDPKEHLENIVFHYATLYLLGVYHHAVTRENVTLEGKLIDYEDVVFTASGNEILIRFELQHCQKKQAPYPWYKGQRLFTSSLHIYLDAIELSAMGLEYLFNWKAPVKNVKTLFWNMLKRLEREIFDIDPEFMNVTKMLLEDEALYQRGESSTKDIFPASKILKKIPDRKIEILKEQDLMVYRHVTYGMKLKRPQLKTHSPVKLPETLLEDGLVEKILRRLQLESTKGELTQGSALISSSEANRYLLNHLFIFPFELKNRKIKLKFYNRKKMHHQIQEQVKSLGAKFLRFEEEAAEGNFRVIKGACVLLNEQEHTLLIGPYLVK